ncbi:MAG: FAD/NAD(P)-binding protein [Planctomycetaceae bacterium]
MTTTQANNPPVSPWTTAPIILRSTKAETPGVFTAEFEFKCEQDAARFASRPGQFNMLYCPGYGESAISLSRVAANSSTLVHTIRSVGDVTNRLARLKIGESIGLRGPFGNGWPDIPDDLRHLIVVGGGIGLAPLRPVIEQFLENHVATRELTVLVGARSCEHLLFADEFQSWRDAGATVIATVDRSSPEWKGEVGVVPALIDRLNIGNPAQTHLFACGPEIMMSYSATAALDRDIPRDNIWFSMERHMNCAIGHCGRCQFGSHFICTGGPVFRYNDVQQLLTIHGL